MRSRRQRGFTLLEISVVVTIIAVLATVLVIRLPSIGGGGRTLDEELARFTALVDLASDEAMLEGRDLGVRIEDDSYAFYAFDYDRQAWLPLPEELRERLLPEGIRFELVLEGRAVTLESAVAEDDTGDGEQQTPTGPVPQILILSSGELTPFQLTMDSEFVDYEYLITGLPFGGTEVKLEE